jgi:hypothetical protein
MYTGRYVWNRRRSRKKLKSGDREYLLRPVEEWVIVSHPELRIVSEEPLKAKTRAKPRQQSFAAGVGRALRRAAKDAQKIARMYGTPLYVWEKGKVVARKP